MKNKHAPGFTLLEMSIVLVIIAVLIGSIMFGHSLLVSSRLQTVITDLDSYTSAVGNFKQAYQSLPGDYANATNQWGTDAGTCPTGGGATGTCNGNGDGMITSTGSQSQANEPFLVWQHLRLAGMFNQSLSNEAGGGGNSEALVGTNIPNGSIKGGGFDLTWIGTISSGNANLSPGFYGNAFVYGSFLAANPPKNAILTPDQASSIDAKIDDGVPSTGKVRSTIYNSTITPNCTTSAGVYNTGNNTRLCPLYFVMGF